MAHAAHRLFILALLVNLSPKVWSVPAHAFNIDRIHAQYRNGDFDKVIRELEAFKKTGRTCSYSDSLFLEKYLAVVYAANPVSRELGRYHMHKLLDLAPAAELLDMFVGDEVDKVFEKVRKEHAFNKAPVIPSPVPPQPRPQTRVAVVTVAPTPAPTPIENTKAPLLDSIPKPAAEEPKETMFNAAWNQPGTWIGGGTALALVAFTIYYASSPKQTAAKTYVVPATASN